ncbi:hypothetical protein CGRA01v4_13034 [Colletotrichum graminicola]|nr:hypothetical protein CGRA01v4_13034 [Colletotrichum graminicola]
MPYKLREGPNNASQTPTLRKANDAGCQRRLGHPYSGLALHYTCRIPFIVRPPVADQVRQLALPAARKRHEPTIPRCWLQKSTISSRIFAAGNLAIVARSLHHAYRPIWSPDRMDGAVDSWAPRAGYPQQISQTSGSIRTLWPRWGPD